MEAVLTFSTLTVYDDHGTSIAEWTLAELEPDTVRTIIDAIRSNNRDAIEALQPQAQG